jgi:hypothetical protein
MKPHAMKIRRKPPHKLDRLRRKIKQEFDTYAAAALAIGCSESHLKNIVARRRTPSVRLLRRITDETGLRIGLDAFG